MISELVKFANKRFKLSQCKNCNSNDSCHQNCEQCLKNIHFSQSTSSDQKYNCKRMADFYVCKYAYRYTSELIYAFLLLDNLRKKEHINILSVGCGPCTDLLALDYLEKSRKYNFTSIDYRGVELDTKIWENIYNDISLLIPHNWNYRIIPENICSYVNVLLQQNWKPDLIVFQYVFSDMCKHMPHYEIETTINTIAKYVDSCFNGICIVCNDINLSTQYRGGREYFDELYSSLKTQTMLYRFHFNNNNKVKHYDYGEEYLSNNLIIFPKNEIINYNPYLSCASAQMIIVKE